jgi:opacity protein-like surface antigen
MTRTKPDSTAIWSTGAAPGTGDILRSDSFDSPWKGGIEARAGVKRGIWGVEAAAFWLGQSNPSLLYTSAGGGATVIQTNPTTTYGLGAGNTLTFNYSSRINSWEVNGTWDAWRGVTLLAGLRTIRLTEQLNAIGAAGGVPFETDTWDTRNRLWGGQIGARFDFLQLAGRAPSPWIVDGHARVGVFRNSIDNTMSRSSVQLFSGSFSNTAWAWLGGVDVGYRFTNNVALTLGYEALWLNGVALAPNQVQATPNFNGGGPFTAPIGVRTEDVLYHGAKLTLRVRI